MRPFARTVSAAALLLVASAAAAQPAEATTWRWDLQEGQAYAYAYRATTDIAMTMGGAGEMTDRVGIETDLELRVRRVLPDGRFDLEIPIRRLVIESASGHQIQLSDLPPQVRTLRAWMTPQGQFEFYERVVVEVQEGGAYGIATLKPRGQGADLQATVGTGDMEMTASASVDPSTGQVRLTHEVRETQRPGQAEEERDVQHIDVLPVEILSLLELPDGPVNPGDRVQLDLPIGQLQVEAGPAQPCGPANCGTLRVRMDGDSEAMTGQVRAAAATDDDPLAPSDMDAGMMDLSGMGMDLSGLAAEMEADLGALMGSAMGGPGGPGGLPAAMVPDLHFEIDANSLFDAMAGRMYSVEGRSGVTTEMAGFRLDERTEFRLTYAGTR